MQKIDLLPCPFCGQEKYIVALADGHCGNRQYQIVCDASGEGGCGASCGWQDTLKEAKEAWNTRASCLISRSERMPDKDGYYLCVINGEFKILRYGNGEFYCKWDDGVLSCCNSSVTHWMQLPEKPIGE